MSDHVTGLFPTPFMRVEGLLGPALVASLVDYFSPAATQTNRQSLALAHSEILNPDAHPLCLDVVRLVAPKLVDFGALLFGERLDWRVKELWVNLLQTGGRQSVHNHANSFVSGVIYLTRSHPSANTVFMKGLGGRDFVFNNTNANSALGPFNADQWVMPEAAAGDMVLFPSYLLHEVPVNQGGQRISLAFNAMPQRLDSWGYGMCFSK